MFVFIGIYRNAYLLTFIPHLSAIYCIEVQNEEREKHTLPTRQMDLVNNSQMPDNSVSLQLDGFLSHEKSEEKKYSQQTQNLR